jgi:hypothetical protein
MFREVLTEEEETDFLQEAINSAVMGKEEWTIQIEDDTKENGHYFKRFKPEELIIHVIDTEFVLVGYEEWCLTWFSHYTFDNGQSDEEVLRSFGAYTHRWRSSKDKVFTTLMGADDRWRWKGTLYPDGSSKPIETDPPCRCQYCKEQGVIRINH